MRPAIRQLILNRKGSGVAIPEELNGLIAGWGANRTSGAWVDFVGGVSAAEVGTVASEPGLFGNAASFNKIDNAYFRMDPVPDVLQLGSESFSYVVTMYMTDDSGHNEMIQSMHDSQHGGFFTEQTTRLLRFYNAPNSAFNPSLDEWHTVAFTWENGVSAKYYLNGTLSADLGTFSWAGTSTWASLGAGFNAAAGAFSGYINQILVFDHAVSEATLDWIYNAGAGRDVSTYYV
jgi:hypothetical protein